MLYNNIYEAKFISRPNRFIALAELDGEEVVCHVKNTGRCKELLLPGARVLLEKTKNESRKTLYDLVMVYKGDLLINMDSQAPNAVFGEWLQKTDCFGSLTKIKPECKYKNSRFDFYLEAGERKIFVEVKGVTLEEDGVVLFPDAPTERGIKHVNELIEAKKDGYEAYLFFIIQMETCRYFTPNVKTHSEFGDALKKAREVGVELRAVTCHTEKNSLSIAGIKDFVDIRL